jgi:hypothetical protein
MICPVSSEIRAIKASLPWEGKGAFDLRLDAVF